VPSPSPPLDDVGQNRLVKLRAYDLYDGRRDEMYAPTKTHWLGDVLPADALPLNSINDNVNDISEMILNSH
jgi:hypothetical protein